MTNQEAIGHFKQTIKYWKEEMGAPSIYGISEIAAAEKAIKALSVDYDGMVEEIKSLVVIQDWIATQTVFEIIKKYVENKEE